MSEFVIVVKFQLNNFSAMSSQEQIKFDEMMMMSALY